MQHAPRITEAQVALVEADFAQVAPAAEAFAARFYANLFALAPWTRMLFRSTDQQAQARKLAGALALLVQNLRRPEAIQVPLRELGARHAGYGVNLGHYGDVAGALLATLRQTLGADSWTTPRIAAWTAAYTVAAHAMQQGAAQAELQAAA